MTTARYFAFDTETSGFEPAEGAEILSYAYIVLDENLEEIARKQRFFFPKGQVPAAAAAVNGYTKESWAAKGAMAPEALKVHIQYDLEKDVPNKCIPLGHNVQFDLRFFKAYGPAPVLRNALDYHAADTMVLAIALDQAFGLRGSYKLTDLCVRYGVTLAEAHDSLHDVQATVALYRRLIQQVRGDAELPAAAPPAPGASASFFKQVGGALVFNKGKYTSETLQKVASMDRSYLFWAMKTVELTAEERDAVMRVCSQ